VRRRSTEQIMQIERLQRCGERQHNLQYEPDGDELLEAASHKSLAGTEYKLSTGCARRVATAESLILLGDVRVLRNFCFGAKTIR
jgi:hypothetical protein